jgi:hypothetical protein
VGKVPRLEDDALARGSIEVPCHGIHHFRVGIVMGTAPYLIF